MPVKLNSLIKKSITVSPNQSILDVRDVLLRYNIGRVVVQVNQKPVGIITEKDLARALSLFAEKPIAKIRASDIMSKDLITVNQSDSIFDCARLMQKHGISSIIVINNSRNLVGVITKTDLVSVFLIESAARLTVSKVMSRKVITVDPDDSLYLVQSTLINNKISRVIVAKNKTLVGIITYRDFVPAKTFNVYQEFVDPAEAAEIGWSRTLNEFNVNRLSYLLTFSAKDIMTKEPIVVNPDDVLYTAAILLTRNRISGLPVVKGKKLVGVLTKTDIVNVLANNKARR